MDIRNLFDSCKRGDIVNIKNLVEVREVELNIRDKWDSTPLYYACLCGHIEVVTYLLENGAKCEANTFDGERCLYGALSDEIRNILKQFKVITVSVIRRDGYKDFLRRLQEEGSHADIEFSVHGHRFPAHRCILAARSTYFSEMLKTKWAGQHVVHLNHEMILPKAFHAVLSYMYTDHMSINLEHVDDCMRLAKQCCLARLIHELSHEQLQCAALQSHKPGMQVTMICVESDDNFDHQQQLGQLADLAIPPELCNIVVGELPFQPDFTPLYADVSFKVSGHYFDCHKAFFCGRSDYFKALLTDHFGENEESEDKLPVITLHNVTPKVFVVILQYIYQDSCLVSGDLVYDVIYTADLYLLPGLKRKCGNTLASYIRNNNVIEILRTARLFMLAKLQDSCYRHIADNLEQIVEKPEFIELIVEDANNIKNREATDTIEVIDEVRYHMTNFIQTVSEMVEAGERLALVDRLLEDLDLEG